jgi:hypothetical protein
VTSLQAELARWFVEKGPLASDHDRLVLADALESTGTFGRLCALQVRLSQHDDPLKALLQARLGSRDSFGPRVLYLSNDYGQWKTAAEARVRDRRVRFELIKLWHEVLDLIRQLEQGRENELASFSTYATIDRGVPAGLRTTSDALRGAASLEWTPPHLEVVAPLAELGGLLGERALRGLPSLSLLLVGAGEVRSLPVGALQVQRLSLNATDQVPLGLLQGLARAGWLEQVQVVRVPAVAMTSSAVQALLAAAPALTSVRLHTIPTGPVGEVGKLFELASLRSLVIEGVREFTTAAEWQAVVGPDTPWWMLRHE